MMSKRIAALAGRRIDAPEAKIARFPFAEMPRVRRELRDLFAGERIETLVCAAACGADLIALEQALDLGMRCRVVLPFPVDVFRRLSVVDRPGDWGALYDTIIDNASATNELIELDDQINLQAAFSAANRRILLEAARDNDRPFAVVAWDGVTRGPDDVTAEFLALAVDSNFDLRTIETCRTR